MSTSLESLVQYGLPQSYNWNMHEKRQILPSRPNISQISKLKIVDEALRDGLHGAQRYPKVSEMLKYTEALSRLGIDTMTVGIYPGENGLVGRTIKELLGNMKENFPEITPIVLSLATAQSLQWAAECKNINPNLQAIVFMGTAPFRLLVEEWSEQQVLDRLAWAVYQATYVHGIDVIGATEHTTQTPPDFLRKIVKAEVQAGAKFFCIADTVGIAQPVGTYQIVKFVRQTLDSMGRSDVMIDWHGHRDTGNEVQNALTAIAAGANRIHTVPLGIGERAGNTPMEAVLINCTNMLKEAGQSSPWNMKELENVLKLYRRMAGASSKDHGTLGERAFYTSLGIHAASILKAFELAAEAEKKGHADLARQLRQMARTIYSAIDPESVGRMLEIGVGPWSGKSNVLLAAMMMGIDLETLSDERVHKILQIAKDRTEDLTPEELKDLLTK